MSLQECKRGECEWIVNDEGGCSHAHAGLEPAVVGREWPEEAAAEEEIDVDGSAGVAGSAGDREEGCVGRDEQGSGSKKRSKHGEQGRMCIFWDFVCNGGDKARSGREDTGSEESRTKQRGVLYAG